MTTLAIIDHETGDLSQWSLVLDATRFSVTNAAALKGNYGVEYTLPNTSYVYCQKSLTASISGKIQARFYFDPRTFLTVNSTYIIHVFTLLSSTNIQARVDLWRLSGQLRIRANIYGDVTNDYVETVITDAPHYIEIRVFKATSAIASDGYITLWIDGVLIDTKTIDNYDWFDDFQRIRMGGYKPSGVANIGPVYLDNVLVNDDGNYIGPNDPSDVGGQVSLSSDLVNDIILNDVLVQDMISATVLVGDVAISDGEG